MIERRLNPRTVVAVLEASGRRYLEAFLVSALVALLVLASACGDDAASNEAPSTAPPASPVFEEFDPANFSNSTVIDNEWAPMSPGTQWVFEGSTVEEGVKIPHRIEFTVTDLTKEILGVRTVVAWIVDVSNGQVVEKEIAFYAQDDDGTVWYFGEHPEEYKDGEFVTAPTWIAGVEEAMPGVKMWPEPKVGMPSYFQGWGPTVEWSDYGTVDEIVKDVCVPAGCYKDALIIAESSLEEVGIYQLKYYARGVGEIRTGFRGQPESPEELELIASAQLSPEALAAVRAETLALEAHAYEISGEYYHTLPSE